MEKKQNQNVATTKPQAPAVEFNPFAKQGREHVNAGTVSIEESRATAEAMGKLYLAKKFPRDEAQAFEKVMAACRRKSLAESAAYSFKRGDSMVTGPSIRLAETLAAAWGNIDYGIRELAQKDGESEMEAYCHDLESNTYSSQKFTVKHERSTRQGTKKLIDQRDIYENNANLGARRLRARILAVIPADLVESAEEECKKTVIGDLSKIAERITKMMNEFKKYGVTQAQIEKRIEKNIDKIGGEDLSGLINIYNSMKDGISKAVDWFEQDGPNTEPGTELGDLNSKIKGDEEEEKSLV